MKTPTIKQRLFSMLRMFPGREWSRKEIITILDSIRGAQPGCQYTFSLDSGSGFTSSGYLRHGSTSCPYYLENIRRGFYIVKEAVVDSYVTQTPVSSHIRGNQYQYVLDTIDQEGFHYAFESYSDFSNVQDPHLTELINKYLEAANALESYLNNMSVKRAADLDHYDPQGDSEYWELYS